MSFCACESKCAACQCLNRPSLFITPWLLSFTRISFSLDRCLPSSDGTASCDECGRRRGGFLSFLLLGKSGGRGGAEGPVRGSRWPPRLSALFKEHCGRSPESNKPDYTACGNLRPLGARLPILPHQDLMLKF